MEEPVPTYQYACTACNHQLEAVQSFTDDPLKECPVCDGRLRKLFGAVGIVFKGPGFYRTDSRSAANGRSKGDSDAASKPSANGDESSGGGKESKESKQKATAGTSASTPAGTSASTSASTSAGSD
jgi:putative FmdB family regulatory protein